MNAEKLAKVILAPHVSEKTAMAAESGQKFVFKVTVNSTKTEIKAAVEQMFEVKVDAVNTIKVKGKTKMFKGRPGKRKDWKKAYVTLAEGQSLELLGNE